MLCSALPAIPSKTLPSKDTVRPCFVSNPPNLSQILEDNIPRLSSIPSQGIPVLPMKIAPQTSYMEEPRVVISLELQSLGIDDLSSDTCPALIRLNPLKTDLLPYNLTNCSQNELRERHSGSLPSPSTRYGHSPQITSRGWAEHNQGFTFDHIELFVFFMSSLLLIQCLFGSKDPRKRGLPLSSNLDPRTWGLSFHKTSQVYEKPCVSLEPKVPAGKKRLRWKCVS